MSPKRTKKSSDTIGVRSQELHRKVKALVDANPGKVTMSDFVRAAVAEKLERVEKGEDSGIILKVPGKRARPVDLGESEVQDRRRGVSSPRRAS
jgi:hypothetical protein